MYNNRISIIEFPSNLGLNEPVPGKEPGVKRLPSWLKDHGFYELLAPEKTQSITPPRYSIELDKDSQVRNADAIIRYAKQQVELLLNSLNGETLPVILGGDCSILIGNAIALKKLGKFGLFFLDGHTDFITPELSQTGGAAGMDLAIVTGYGHPKLTDIYGLKPYFNEENVWCVGNREYDDEYIAPILKSNIKYFDLNKIRRVGIDKCIHGFYDIVEQNGLDGFFIHFDVDVLNDEIMPAVDSRAPGGLSYDELNQILKGLLKYKKVRGIEITILNPDLDPSGKYTKRFISNLGEIFKGI